jgi:hypothetical protein
MVEAQIVEVTLDFGDRDGETCPTLGIEEYFPAWMGRVGERWPGELPSKRDEKFPQSPISTWVVSTGKRVEFPSGNRLPNWPLHGVEHQKCPRGSAVLTIHGGARTVRVHAESVRVPSLLRNLLAKIAGLARKTTCSGSRPFLYIDEGLRPIECPTIDQIKYISRFTYSLVVVQV